MISSDLHVLGPLCVHFASENAPRRRMLLQAKLFAKFNSRYGALLITRAVLQSLKSRRRTAQREKKTDEMKIYKGMFFRIAFTISFVSS